MKLTISRQQFDELSELENKVGYSVIERLKQIDKAVITESLGDDSKIATKYKLIKKSSQWSELTQLGKDLLFFIRSKGIISLDQPECNESNKCLYWTGLKQCKGFDRCRFK